MTEYRSGFVTIIGCPNAGKSTLLNRLIGQKIAIVSSRAQTTRNKITGVLSRDSYQIVFLDTPGITEARNKLGEYMQKTAYDSLTAVEAVLFVADATKGIGERDQKIIDRLSKVKTPLLALINKCDATSKDSIDKCKNALLSFNVFKEIYCGSAETGEGIDALENALSSLLPAGPQYFPDDMVTDQPERIICGEIVREKALNLLREEIPHGIGVSIDKMELRDGTDLMDVYATIYCERDSHKAIIIGKGGTMLKKIGAASRLDMEQLTGYRINLQVWVKVKEDWRNKPSVLHELGYE